MTNKRATACVGQLASFHPWNVVKPTLFAFNGDYIDLKE